VPDDYPKDGVRRVGEYTRIRNIPVSIDIVVECEFLVLQDVTLCKDAHANMVIYCPLCDVAVWLAAVICETTNPAALRRIDELRKWS
jgi:hypothetical protein